MGFWVDDIMNAMIFEFYLVHRFSLTVERIATIIDLKRIIKFGFGHVGSVGSLASFTYITSRK